MRVIHSLREMQQWSHDRRARGSTIGFVPTMGCLHDGHMALVRHGRTQCDKLVASIFVNPMQFGPSEDFAAYPRTPERDVRLLEENGADCLFLPEPAEIYPPGFRSHVTVEGLSDKLCGAHRAGHFRGVCTVVAKLLNLVAPDEAWFGEKDAQQLRIIRRMVTDLDMPVRITGCPTVRETDGLAMSSRNVYLSAEERPQAAALWRALIHAQELTRAGETDAGVVLRAVRDVIARDAPAAAVEYAHAVDDDTLDDVAQLDGRVLLALAVRLGRTRLIDNIVLDLPERAAMRGEQR